MFLSTRRIKSTIVIIIVLSFALVSLPEIGITKADYEIYLRDDGTVDGKDKIQISGSVYSFTANITGSIVVERHNIVLDGAGFVLQGHGNGTGISLTNRSNVTIRNVHIEQFTICVFVDNSSNSNITGNKIANDDGFQGIRLNASSFNSIEGNEIMENINDGIFIEYKSAQNSVTGNYLTNNKDGIRISGCSDNTISENYVANNVRGKWLASGTDIYVSGNNVTNNNKGIEIGPSFDNVLRDNRMTNNKYNFESVGLDNHVDVSNTIDGKPVYYWVNQHDKTVSSEAGYIALVDCARITVQNLSLTKNLQGILLSGTINSMISGNNLTKNNKGIEFFYESTGNRIYGNNIANNERGIRFTVSLGNIIYNNNFVSNIEQVSDYSYDIRHLNLHITPSENIWDNGKEGNYWSTYNGVDSDGDGIGDTPYIINPDNTDNYH